MTIPFSVAHDHGKWKEFLDDDTKRNALIYGPTQSHKTKYLSDSIIRSHHHYDALILLSCSNHKDEAQQTFSRLQLCFQQMSEHRRIHHFKISTSGGKNKTLLKSLKKILLVESSPTIVLQCLDNFAQISSTHDILVLLHSSSKDKFPKRILLFHDEGDVITKDMDTEHVSPTQTQSHQQWIQLTQWIGSKSLLYKRIFCTATPENVLFKYPIQTIFRVPLPFQYQGPEKVQGYAVEVERSSSSSEISPFPFEYELECEIRHTLSSLPCHPRIFLYCTDRQITTNGQQKSFQFLCNKYIRDYDHHHDYKNIVICMYNGRGIEFESSSLTMTTSIQLHYSLYPQGISYFYEACRKSGVSLIITIGMDLMSRGISFVSKPSSLPESHDMNDKNDIANDQNVIAATVMFYRPGAHIHAVALQQAIGRITGTACPMMERKLYASSKIIQDYQFQYQNQIHCLDAFESSSHPFSNEFMQTYHYPHRVMRPLDRKRLGLHPLYDKKINPSRQKDILPSSKERGEEGVDMNRVQYWIQHPNCSITSKIIHCLFQSQCCDSSLSLEHVRQAVDYPKSVKSFRANIENGASCQAQYGRLWIVEDQYRKMRLNPRIFSRFLPLIKENAS
jgi:hypothetical protein